MKEVSMKRLLQVSCVVALVLGVVAETTFAQPWTKQTTPTVQRIRGLKPLNSQVVWASGNAGAVLRTLNGGTTWELKPAPDGAYDNYCIEAIDSLTAWIYGTIAGGAQGASKIWKTAFGGKTWVEQYNNADTFADGIIFFDANNGVAWSDPTLARKTVFVMVTTTNGGSTWVTVPPANIPPVDSVADEVSVSNACDVIGNTVWFTTYCQGSGYLQPKIFKSTDKGYTWTASPLLATWEGYGFSMRDANTGIVSNTSFGSICRTTNAWATSDTVLVLNGTYGLRAVDWLAGGNAIAIVGGPTGTGISATSLDGGTTWTQQAVPAGVGRLYAVRFLDPTTGWAAGNGGAILKWTGSPLVGVDEKTPLLPDGFSLSQNYPNPFNPGTTIEYAISRETSVQLKVYDMLGRELVMLVNDQQSAGSYKVKFDAHNLASGVYYYTLKAGSFVSTKSLILMK
jgi:photosystem II stability/assembly factor-like uncharacterized protein